MTLHEAIQIAIACWQIAAHGQYGLATTFSAKGDPQNPDPHLACFGRDLDDRRDMVVASRTLPCRSRVRICLARRERCVTAVVGDRGPWGRKRNGQYRAMLDLAPRVKRALRHSGYERVLYWSVP